MITVIGRRGTPADPLTPRQRSILEAILDIYCRTGAFPTIRDIGDATDIGSPNGVVCHLNCLVDKGWMLPPGDDGRKCWRLTDRAIREYRLVEATPSGRIAVRLLAPQVVMSADEVRDLVRLLTAALKEGVS